jgi:hypothetical protein
MTKIIGPFDRGDFLTMQMLKANIKYYNKKDPEAHKDVIKQHRNNLKEYFQKVA